MSEWRKLIRGKESHIVVMKVETVDVVFFPLMWCQLIQVGLENELVVVVLLF